MLEALITFVREDLADGQHWSICVDNADSSVCCDAWGYRTCAACISDVLKYKASLQAEGYIVILQLVVCE